MLPVGIRYSWRQQRWTALDERLTALENHLGVDGPRNPTDDHFNEHRSRLLNIGAALMTALEQMERLRPEEARPLTERIETYRLHGLAKAEAHFQLRAGGTLQERCRRIEQAAWDRIYREGLEDLPALKRSLADWEAREADLQLTCMHRWNTSPASAATMSVISRPSTDWLKCCRGGSDRLDRGSTMERGSLAGSAERGAQPRGST